jgi:hypothetical protein
MVSPSKRVWVGSSLSQYVSASDGSSVGLLYSSKVEMEAVSMPPTSRFEDTLVVHEAGSVAVGATVIRCGEPWKFTAWYVPCVTSRVQSPAYGMAPEAVREAWAGEEGSCLHKRG